MEVDSPHGSPALGSSGYKRASRKGAPRRFSCDYPNCGKLYSRAEHLQRHQLNRESLFQQLPAFTLAYCSLGAAVRRR
jgi:hypothetical protein